MWDRFRGWLPGFATCLRFRTSDYGPCPAQIEMSRAAPDRNVTHEYLQSGGGRARSPHIAQSPAAARDASGAAQPP